MANTKQKEITFKIALSKNFIRLDERAVYWGRPGEEFAKNSREIRIFHIVLESCYYSGNGGGFALSC